MKRIVLLLLCLIIIISGCTTKDKEEVSNEPVSNIELEIIKTENCQNKVTKYYERDNRTVYLVCLDEVNLENQKMTLSYHFNNVNQSFERSIKELVNGLKEIESYKDGGTKVYKNDKMAIITCNKILDEGNNNQDIYIGDENLKLEEDFCTRN